MKSSAFRLMAVLGLFLVGTACTPIDGNSLLTNQKDDPSAYQVDKTPKSEELYLKVYNPTVNTTAAMSKAEISGECYVSTYPKHEIVALENGSALEIVDLNTSTDVNSNVATCKNGKFNLAIKTTNLAAGVHSVRFVLQAYDADNIVVTNDVQGASAITLTK